MLSGKRTLTRRSLLTAAGTGVAFLALSACGADEPDPAASSAGTRTIPGQLGDIEVPQSPQRIVSVGQYRDTDAAVALGVVPLLSPDLSLFIPGGIAPWVERELGSQTLEIIDVAEMPYEKVAQLRPDLILATDRQNLAEEYDRLSGIAPTMSWEQGYNQDDWRTTTTRVGEALGKSEAADQQIALTDDAIAKAVQDNPEFAGRTFTLGPVTADGTVNTINSTDDASAEFLAQLGLELAPSVTDLPSSGIPGRAIISPEQLALLDADVLMLTFNTPEAQETLEANPLFQAIPAVKRGSYVALDLTTAIAIGFPSALSVRYGIEEIVPKVRDALAA